MYVRTLDSNWHCSHWFLLQMLFHKFFTLFFFLPEYQKIYFGHIQYSLKMLNAFMVTVCENNVSFFCLLP
jgi:hypothetical protein